MYLNFTSPNSDLLKIRENVLCFSVTSLLAGIYNLLMIINYYMEFISKAMCGTLKYEVITIKYSIEYVNNILINEENHTSNPKENIK